jgi:hypothetical protein
VQVILVGDQSFNLPKVPRGFARLADSSTVPTGDKTTTIFGRNSHWSVSQLAIFNSTFQCSGPQPAALSLLRANRCLTMSPILFPDLLSDAKSTRAALFWTRALQEEEVHFLNTPCKHLTFQIKTQSVSTATMPSSLGTLIVSLPSGRLLDVQSDLFKLGDFIRSGDNLLQRLDGKGAQLLTLQAFGGTTRARMFARLKL